MNKTGQVFATWCGPVGLVLFGTSYGPLAGNFLPPPSPSLPLAGVTDLYFSNMIGVRLAAILMMTGATLFCVFFAAISAQMQRRPGNRALAYGQLATGTVVATTLLMTALFWAIAAFRGDRSASEVMLLNDMAWITNVMPAGPGTVQALLIGIAILTDTTAVPELPRWLGYLNIWAGLLFLPGYLVAFFHNGPFGWNGLFAFWMVAIVFTVWLVLMTIWMLKATRHFAKESGLYNG